MAAEAGAIFSLATWNLRGVSDRWQERQPLLKQSLKEADAHIYCFQECLTGEFAQECRVLPPLYHIFPCKAALFNLARSGGLLRWYAHMVERMLRVPPLCRFLVSLPEMVESRRERWRLKADLFRAVRDLTMAPFFGNSVACRIAEAHKIKHSTLVLGDWRTAQRIELYIGHDEGKGRESPPQQNSGAGGGGGCVSCSGVAGSEAGSEASLGEWSAVSACGSFKVWVVNTHLDHEHTDNRHRQALAVCDWMDKEKHDCAAIILCGDFNGAPHEAFHSVLRRLGYVSAYAARHGREPQGTWPTGIQAPLMDKGSFECLDYVYIWAAPAYTVDVLSADVYGLEPAKHDATLFPSDHAAVKATIQISRKQPVDLQGPQQSCGGGRRPYKK